MKYGLITFKKTENIGDDIQSYAAMSFLPKVDYYIEREKMDLFIPKNKEQVVTIMNGWFLHSKINFPISPYIYPLYVSTHFSGYNSGGIKKEYLNDYASKKLNKYGPIGCRDHGTMELLEQCNVKNYFSGCVTLTLKADKNIKQTDSICIVDINEKAEEKIRKIVNNGVKIIKKTHVLDKSKNSKLTWEERFDNVKKLLDIYQSSKLVITSRLHCALPCLALGTPVLLLYDEKKDYTKDRLSDYVNILNHMTTKEFINGGYKTLDTITSNPQDYKKIRNKIINKIKLLLDDSKIKLNTNLPELKEFEELYVNPKKNIDNLYEVATNDMYIRKNDYVNLKYERDYWKKEYKNAVKLKEEAVKLKEEAESNVIKLEHQLNRIRNIWIYKVIRKVYNVLKGVGNYGKK